MTNLKLNKDQIRDLLPHREPMLLIDDLVDIQRDIKEGTFDLNLVNYDFSSLNLDSDIVGRDVGRDLGIELEIGSNLEP